MIEDARFRYGIFVNRGHQFSITGNEISNISERAMCLLNECHTFSVSDNYIHHNALGGIFANGETHHGIFEANRICYNEGSSNATPALFIGQHYLVDDHYAITEYHETDQTELVHSGHDLVIIENDFSHNRAQ